MVDRYKKHTEQLKDFTRWSKANRPLTLKEVCDLMAEQVCKQIEKAAWLGNFKIVK